MAQRLRGEEVEVLLVVNNVAQQTTTDIKSFDATFDLEKKSEGYLGQTSEQKDEIFKGVDGSIEFHFENTDVFDIIDAIVARATRRTPGTIFNIKATLNFPNGERARFSFPDVHFGPVPLNFASRADYGSIKLDWTCSTYNRI